MGLFAFRRLREREAALAAPAPLAEKPKPKTKRKSKPKTYGDLDSSNGGSSGRKQLSDSGRRSKSD